MKNRLLHFTIALFVTVSFSACGGDQQNNSSVPVPQPSHQEVKDGLIKSHQMYIKQETDEITQYIKNHNYTMQALKTGMYYMIYEHGKGMQPVVGDYARVDYKISLLDGTVCYDSKKDGSKYFKVGEDAVESGVHQAVQLMHSGDKGIFIAPSYMAQGLVGDKDKIPPDAVVIYDITLVLVKKVNNAASSK